MRTVFAVLFFVCLFSALSMTRAGVLVSVSDLISTSAPSATSTHVVTFTLASAVPPSGIIRITPQDGAFTLQSGFDYTDVDLAVSSGGPFSERDLSASAGTSADGVTISGNAMSVTLNSVSGLTAGDIVRLTLGDASHGVIGDRYPVSASSVGSYRISIATEDGLGTLDAGTAMIALVLPVTTSVLAEALPPARVNGLPSGTIAAGNDEIEISFETNEAATCRYATTTDVAYTSMTGTFSSADDDTLFYTTIEGHVNNTTYSYYVRCIDEDLSINTDDYAITFTLEADPVSNTSIESGSSSSGSGGVGDFPGGSSVLYLAGFELSGWAPGGSTVTILQDGVVAQTVQAGSDGLFEATIERLERGVYTFAAYARDSGGRTTSSHTSTLSLESGTNNRISDILLSPTLASLVATPPLGEDLDLLGESVPGSTVRVTVSRKIASLLSQVSVSSASTTGSSWRSTIPGARISEGSFVIQARAEIGDKAPSSLSPPLVIGVGEKSPSTTGSPDINGDGRVNLTDFSIMLSAWGTSDSGSDFNGDGIVNLADFSILLFNWTG